MIGRPFRGLRAAVSFLTTLPVGGEDDPRVLAGSVFWYPLVGLLLGGTVALAALMLAGVFPQPLAAVLAVLLLTLLTGALHLDGLADTADGFFCARTRGRMLDIMRDSRIGVMGVLALLFDLGIKTVALSMMPAERMSAALVLMPLVGRLAILVQLQVLPYARSEGCASVFYQRKPTVALTCGLLLVALVAAAAGGRRAIAATMAAVVLVLFFVVQCRNKIGGATGDTLGAASELAEIAVAVVMAAAFAS